MSITISGLRISSRYRSGSQSIDATGKPAKDAGVVHHRGHAGPHFGRNSIQRNRLGGFVARGAAGAGLAAGGRIGRLRIADSNPTAARRRPPKCQHRRCRRGPRRAAAARCRGGSCCRANCNFMSPPGNSLLARFDNASDGHGSATAKIDFRRPPLQSERPAKPTDLCRS